MDVAGTAIAMALFLLIFFPEGGGQIAAKVYKGFQMEMAKDGPTEPTPPAR